jgi:hypothetical protein
VPVRHPVPVGTADKGIAVERTDSTDAGRVGAPDRTDSRADAIAAPSEEADAAASWGTGSPSAMAATPRRRMLLENILSCKSLMIEQI